MNEGDERLERVRATIEEMAGGDLTKRVGVSPARDTLDAIAYGVNVIADELQLAAREAEAASRAKTQFLANVSHEIRTPMTAILGFADVVRQFDLTAEERKSHLDRIHKNGQALLRLIDDILDLSRIDAGEFSVHLRATSLGELVVDAIGTLEALALRKRTRVSSAVDATLPMVQTDPDRLRQVVLNVVGNAIKFAPGGNVSVALGREGAALAIEVSDDGPGVTDEMQVRLFQPFSQAESSRSRGGAGGAGLGLALSRRIAHALGGDLVLARTAPGKGSTFRVTLPVHPAAEAEAKAKDDQGETRAPSIVGLRVLLAEDSADVRALVRAVLDRAGAQVLTVDDGASAVELACGGGVDVVLMDLKLPVLDGLSAVRRLRARGFDRPIVAVTANAMADDRVRCLDAGCDDFLRKPIDAALLISTLASLSK